MATTVGMAAANATAAGLPREVLKWVQSLDLSYSVKNVRRAFNNGFLIAEIFNRYFPQDLSMHTFSNTENYAKKKDNWKQLQLFFNRRKIPITLSAIDALILNEQDTTLEFVKQIYTLLTERQLLPPVKLYENQDQNKQVIQNNRDILGFQEEIEQEKESQAQQSMNQGLQQSKSPQKSIAIKGPPRIINEKLEIDNYQGVKVTDINVKPVTSSVAQLRAAKDQSSVASNQRFDTHSLGGLSQQASRHQIANSYSQQNANRSQHSNHSPQDPGYTNDNISQTKQRPKTVNDFLQEKISQYVSRQQSSGDQIQAEFAQLNIENDMVNTFFDEIHKMSDHFTFNFIEILKLDIEALLQTLYLSATECAQFFTLMLFLLRRLSPLDGSFTNTLVLIKQVISRINSDQSQSPATEFNKFFVKYIFKSYCGLIKECPNKRQHVCELIYTHCAHDLEMRIKIVQQLKNHLRDDELVYCCQALLLQFETSFNEQWFDVFLYYALIGLTNTRANIRVYSLNMLNTIAKHNPEAMLEVTNQILALANENFWEIKTQCLEFATILLEQYRSYSHLMANKDDLKMGAGPKANSSQGNAPKSNLNLDKTVIKNALQICIDITKKCFSGIAPKSVQKLGLFKLQPLLNDYKMLYNPYVEVLLQVDQEIKQIILSEEPIRAGEEIYFSLGLVSFNYKLRSDITNIDCILLCNSLIDFVINSQFDSLDKEHMQLISLCAGAKAELNPQMADGWLKVYQKMKDYLLVSICDVELCQDALAVLNNFLTNDVLKFQVQEETKDVMAKSIELLYNGDTEECKTIFKNYVENVVSSDDNSLKKFFKIVLAKVAEEHSAVFLSSNIAEFKDKL